MTDIEKEIAINFMAGKPYRVGYIVTLKDDTHFYKPHHPYYSPNLTNSVINSFTTNLDEAYVFEFLDIAEAVEFNTSGVTRLLIGHKIFDLDKLQ